MPEMKDRYLAEFFRSPSVQEQFNEPQRGIKNSFRLTAVTHFVDAKLIRVRKALEETKAHGLRLKSPKSKAGRRDIGLPDIVVEALREHRRQQLEFRMALGAGKPPADALVFPGLEGGPQAPSDVSRAWGLVAEGLGMPEITLHGLRHTHMRHS